jgi:hypothetical protein
MEEPAQAGFVAERGEVIEARFQPPATPWCGAYHWHGATILYIALSACPHAILFLMRTFILASLTLWQVADGEVKFPLFTLSAEYS